MYSLELTKEELEELVSALTFASSHIDRCEEERLYLVFVLNLRDKLRLSLEHEGRL